MFPELPIETSTRSSYQRYAWRRGHPPKFPLSAQREGRIPTSEAVSSLLLLSEALRLAVVQVTNYASEVIGRCVLPPCRLKECRFLMHCRAGCLLVGVDICRRTGSVGDDRSGNVQGRI